MTSTSDEDRPNSQFPATKYLESLERQSQFTISMRISANEDEEECRERGRGRGEGDDDGDHGDDEIKKNIFKKETKEKKKKE